MELIHYYYDIVELDPFEIANLLAESKEHNFRLLDFKHYLCPTGQLLVIYKDEADDWELIDAVEVELL